MDTNYVNASRIKFDKLKQTFIACQAPLPASFKHFWQMVIEEKVEVIVMADLEFVATVATVGRVKFLSAV